MPYTVEGNCVKKKDTGETVKCHDSHEKALEHLRALQANVKDSVIATASLVITKAAFDKSEKDPNKKRRIVMTNSDTSPDLYDEKMSPELFNDFVHRIDSKSSVPEVFQSVVCEEGVWCGGMPYLSIAHYRAGAGGKNLPGDIESVYVDGKQLKSKAYLRDNPLGRAMFDSICMDEEIRRSGSTEEHEPVRVSIGFLDLEHEHQVEGKSVIFTRNDLGQVCPLCSQGIGGKIYKKGFLVHLAATRVPVNPRTGIDLEEKSMDGIITKKDDAASIVGDLANELEEKSTVSDVLVIKADEKVEKSDEVPASPSPVASCYDPNTDSFDQSCIDSVMQKFMVDWRNSLNSVKSDAVERLDDAVLKSLMKLTGKDSQEEPMAKKSDPVVEQAKVDEKDVEEAKEEDKKDEAESKKSDTVSNPVVSPFDASIEAFKAKVAQAKAEGKSVTELQEDFNTLANQVMDELTPKGDGSMDMKALAEIVRSAVKDAIAVEVAPLKLQLAQLSAGGVGKSQGAPVSRAITVTPETLLQKASTQQPKRQYTQIEKIARRSTGAPVD